MVEAGSPDERPVSGAAPSEWRVERRGVISSTQDALRAELEAGREVHGLVIRAEVQTHGKGRMERQWRSGIGGSYQSAAVRDGEGRFRSTFVPLAIALAVAEALHPRVPDIALKWPNDLYLRELAVDDGPTTRLPGKVGGVLCQHLRGHLLIGVGINVRNEVPEGSGALNRFSVDEVSDLVLDGIGGGLRGSEPGLPERYARFDLLAGRRLRVSDGRRELEGRARGIGATGCLLLESSTGTVDICSGRILEIDAAA